MGLILVQFWSVTIMTDFAENLRKFRKNKKYSQAELGRKLHYGSTTIANYESGKLTYTVSFFEDGAVAGFFVKQ